MAEGSIPGNEGGASTVWPIFLCYRQSDGRRTAERLFTLLHGTVMPVAPGQSAGEAPPRLDVYFDQAAPGISDWTTLHQPYLKRARAFIVVCTPGAKLVETPVDWVHREIGWWIENRRQAPILIDALGQDERYVPTSIIERWPNAQRITLRLDEWDQLGANELHALEERTRMRILGGITQSAGNIYREELEREQRRTKELSVALAAKLQR
jgi:hypothetical protein